MPVDAPPRATSSQRRKRSENSVGWCRDRAAEDLLKAAALANANQRSALETSAESWMLRAELLEQAEQSSDERRALVKASKGKARKPLVGL